MGPTIVLVPGFWGSPGLFDEVTSRLHSQGFQTHTTTLSSTGHLSPGNPNMNDDIAALRSEVEKLIDSDKGQQDVVLVLHSGAAFIGSNAIEGLGAKARAEAGKKGGVTRLVFLAGALFPEGFQHSALPFYTIEGGGLYCTTPEKLLFDDLDDDDAKQKWIKTLRPQPAEGWDGTVTYCGWREVPSVYLVSEKDQLIPPVMQEQIAGLAGSKVERCNAGHMAMLSAPDKVAEVVEAAAKAV